MTAVPDLAAAAAAIDAAQSVVDRCAAHIAASGGIDANQQVAYDLAHSASAVDCGRAMLGYGEHRDLEARMTCAFVADAVHDLAAKVLGRESQWGADPGALDAAMRFVR